MAEMPKKTFEEALARLEEIVARLEEGEMALEESLALFEEGVGLARFCQEKLTAAEGRLEMLVAGGTAPFPTADGGLGDGTTSGAGPLRGND